ALQVCNFQSEEITVIRQLGGCNVVMWVCNLCRKTTRNPHQVGSVVLRPGARSGTGCVFEGGPQGKKAKLQDPSLYPYQGAPGDLTPGSDRSRTSRRAPAQTGVP
ncbi:hypothetical protein KUCAC02_014897, partial [Chaenocephalus aceratus]